LLAVSGKLLQHTIGLTVRSLPALSSSRASGGDRWTISLGRYADRAARDRELASMVDDELGTIRGGHQRQVPLDSHGMFHA
jgi:hypothetical protein